jgi:hypothetical protein
MVVFWIIGGTDAMAEGLPTFAPEAANIVGSHITNFVPTT